MAIISVITSAGETLRTQDLANGTTSQVDRIEADAGHVTTVAAAMALTDVVTPFTPVRETTNPQGRALPNDPVAQFRYLDADAVDYGIVGFGIFAGATMTHYICDDGGATIYQKTAGLILDIILHITARSGDQATFTFSDDLAAPLATEIVPGLVRRATSNELRDALAGNNPPAADENDAVTLQAMYDRRDDFGSPDASTTTKGKVELATRAEFGGDGGDQVVTSKQFRFYTNGNVPQNVPADVALVLEEEA